ncbi:uncharacterized protein with HEPN domain [Mucilaginibacter yixingensis]|uniref:Uncharacterized protein with HEPN domain n=1 Tax=Mucilaginibacter yixingensis TaxID=1295612 RepID=A0A2T5JEH3_9SPHI|nr:DUF86 domain-containing protein [Mucilaginibacter yixingensis]PTR00056.1 uncharacterized protein with HEPN domain [Mucilaginibacter yixingensis]
MIRTDKVYIEDIIESINLIEKYTQGITEYQFSNDIQLQDAVTRRFEIIGEASSKISEAIKAKYPATQWKLMKLMRNKLIHEYFGVSAQTIFATVMADLPVLKAQLVHLKQTEF